MGSELDLTPGERAAAIAEAERARAREYARHTLYRRPIGKEELPPLVLTRRARPALTTADVYKAGAGAGDIRDMREYRLRKMRERDEAAGEEPGPASVSAMEARARMGNRNMAEVDPTGSAAASAAGWKRYAERQLRDAVDAAPLVIEHGTVLGVVERWLTPADQQTIWDLGHGVTLQQAALAAGAERPKGAEKGNLVALVTADAIKKRRAKALAALLDLLHRAGERGIAPTPLRRVV